MFPSGLAVGHVARGFWVNGAASWVAVVRRPPVGDLQHYTPAGSEGGWRSL